MTVLQFLKIAAALVTIITGAFAVLRPKQIAAFGGFEVTNARSQAESRIAFGGLFVGLGIGALLLNQPAAYQAVAFGWFGAAITRGITLFIDQAPLDSKFLGSGIYEIVLGIIMML